LSFLKNILFKEISAKGLAVFRMAYFATFFFEILNIYKFRQLYFDEIPFLRPHFPDISLVLLLWLVIIFFQVIGFKFRWLSILNYIFTLVFISSAIGFEYHMFYAYTGINFLSMFLPLSTVWSVDSSINKRRCLQLEIKYIVPKVSKMNYYLPVFLGLALVYFDSVLSTKVYSHLWTSGLGLWLPSSIPQITISENQWLLNQEILVKSLSYITFAFEFLFIFIFWIKKIRIPIIIIGLGLHVGIFLSYPIPFFALGCASIYLLIIPVSFWDLLSEKIKATIFRKYNYQKIIMDFFCPKIDVFKAKKRGNDIKETPFKTLIKKYNNYFLIFLVIASMILQYEMHHSFFKSNRVKAYNFDLWIVKHFGITGHGVFIDSHFNGYESVYVY